MKIIETKKSLIKSLIFLIFGALIFANPNEVVKLTSSIIGTIIIVYGLYLIIKNYYETKNNSDTPSTNLIFGIVCVIIGILFIVLADSIALIIQYILGAWILFTGIERLIIALSLGTKNDKFVVQLVISILLLLAGLYTVLKSNLPLQIVGLVMIIYSVLEIIGYVSNRGNNVTSSVAEEVEERVKITTKEKNEVKEAKIVEEKEDKKEEDKPKKKKKSKK